MLLVLFGQKIIAIILDVSALRNSLLTYWQILVFIQTEVNILIGEREVIVLSINIYELNQNYDFMFLVFVKGPKVW